MGERLVGDWAISTHIGSGSFAIVWRARHRLSGQEAAIKEIALDKLNSKLRQSLESEVSILKRINHDNIVKCAGPVRGGAAALRGAHSGRLCDGRVPRLPGEALGAACACPLPSPDRRGAPLRRLLEVFEVR